MDEGERCLRRYWDGDEDALEELIGIYSSPLTMFLRGIVRDEGAAEELMLDTFSQLVFARLQFRGEAKFKTYLFTIARNKAIRYLKERARHGVRLEDVPEETASEAELPEASAERGERSRLLWEAMRQLRPDYHEVLYLLYFQDMSYEQAGAVMHKNLKQITNLAYRAKQSLRERLKGTGIEEAIT